MVWKKFVLKSLMSVFAKTLASYCKKGYYLHILKIFNVFKHFFQELRSLKFSNTVSPFQSGSILKRRCEFPLHLQTLSFRVTRDRCYDFKNIFAKKFGEKIGVFDSRQS
jgi:hypothetical protein